MSASTRGLGGRGPLPSTRGLERMEPSLPSLLSTVGVTDELGVGVGVEGSGFLLLAAAFFLSSRGRGMSSPSGFGREGLLAVGGGFRCGGWQRNHLLGLGLEKRKERKRNDWQIKKNKNTKTWLMRREESPPFLLFYVQIFFF